MNSPSQNRGSVKAPAPAKPAMVGSKTKEEINAELQLAAQNPENQQLQGSLEASLQKKDEEEAAELTGQDLDFDPKTFITWGAISKKNIKVLDGMYADMQSLTQKDRIVAEQIVKLRFGNLLVTDNVYMTAMESAIIALAVTRLNNKSYPIPDLSQFAKDPKTYNERLDLKLELYDMLLDANEKLISFLSVLYNRLENADVLKQLKTGIDVPKK